MQFVQIPLSHGTIDIALFRVRLWVPSPMHRRISGQARSHQGSHGRRHLLAQVKPHLPRCIDDIVIPPHEPDVALFIHRCSVSTVVKVPTFHFGCLLWVILQREQHPFTEGNEFIDDKPQTGAQIWLQILLLTLPGTYASFAISLSLFSIYATSYFLDNIKPILRKVKITNN